MGVSAPLYLLVVIVATCLPRLAAQNGHGNAEEMMTYTEALERAFSIYRSGNLQQAYDLTCQITSVATSYAHAFNFLGVLEHERGDIGKSLQAYDKAISLDSTQLEFYTNKGYALKASGRWKETQQIFLHVVEHDPTNKFAWNGLGLAYHYLDQEDKSLAAYDKALVLDPNYAEVYYNKGVSLKYMGDIKEAGVYYWRAIELNPRMHSAIINLAALHQEHGDAEKALEYFEMLTSDDSVGRGPAVDVAHKHGDTLLYRLQSKKGKVPLRQSRGYY